MKSEVKVFISYATAQRPVVEMLRSIIEEKSNGRIKVFSYESDLEFGSDDLWSDINEMITECDHFLVILSKEAKKSESVSRELGLALKLRNARLNQYPTIIGVKPESTSESGIFQPIDFHTKEAYSEAYDFDKPRYLTIGCPAKTNEIDYLIQQLLPKVTTIDSFDGYVGDLFYGSIPCYETLFPDPAERVLPENIQAWIEQKNFYGELLSWCDLYMVLHIGKRVLGMSYATVYDKSEWTFGSYFGIYQEFRQFNRANQFVKLFFEKINNLNCHSQGIVFEVNPVNFSLLEDALKEGTIVGSKYQLEIIENYRNLRRLNLYQGSGAYVALNADGLPLPYWQPAMCDPLDISMKRPLLLMFLPNTKERPIRSFKVKSAVKFIYKSVYADAYGKDGYVKIEGFSSHISELYDKVIEGAADSYFGNLKFPHSLFRSLSKMINDEGIGHKVRL